MTVRLDFEPLNGTGKDLTTSYKISRGVFVDLAQVRTDIETAILKIGITVKADCGPGLVKVVDVGDSLQCFVIAPTGRRVTIDGKVTDESGGVSLRIPATELV